MKKFLIIAVLILSACSTVEPTTVNYLELQETTSKGVKQEPGIKPRPETSIPDSLNIEVPFFSQAPHSNWDYPWQEACEEASILNIANLYKGMGLNVDSFNTELLRLVEWEKTYFGGYEHTSIAQTAEMINLQYNLRTEIRENPSFDDIKTIISNGHLIVAPFAGKFLFNPNFKNGGPNYHMIVIKGYDTEKMQIITNDVGTRKGSNYTYDWSVIQNALHDWNDADITLGEKKIIEVFPS